MFRRYGDFSSQVVRRLFFVICFRADQSSSSSLKALYKGVDGVIQTSEGSQPSNVTMSVSGGFLGDIHGDHLRRNEKKLENEFRHWRKKTQGFILFYFGAGVWPLFLHG